MTFVFEELDHQETQLGEIILRRRSELKADGKVVYEVKLGDEFLMSSLFTDAESELARLGLSVLDDPHLDVVVGGLGLGFTAVAVLDNPSVKSLIVVEMIEPVIEWHRRGLVPLGNELMSDRRCTFMHADFFNVVASSAGGFDCGFPTRQVHAVLLDIDHSPNHWLSPANSTFYSVRGLRNLRDKLHPGGIFGLWSNDPPEVEFTRLLGNVFELVGSHILTFRNPYRESESSSTIYLGQKNSQG